MSRPFVRQPDSPRRDSLAEYSIGHFRPLPVSPMAALKVLSIRAEAAFVLAGSER